MQHSTTDGTSQDDKNDICTSSDEWSSSSYLHDIGSCTIIQEEISDCFNFIKTFINDEDFVSHVRIHSTELKDIEEKMDQHLLDLKRTDGAIVFAGETSSGKSSIVNAVIGEKILPTGITATTTKVCRVRHSEELIFATCDEDDADYNDWIPFDNTIQLAEKLKENGRTNDNSTYVDIFMPIPFKEGNITIVDTPGIGDIDQNEVAERMMNYLPNALAFVFVINVAAAGGFQKDRFIRILEHVKSSLQGMVSFDHDDVIFLLNKWDTLLDDDEKDTFFESAKENLSSIWKAVKPQRILKLSMNKAFEEQSHLFKCFTGELKDVIEKNKEKRLEVHKRFLERFIDDCDIIVSPEYEKARKIAKSSEENVKTALTNVSDLKEIWQEETLKLNENINRFLEAVIDQLHEYVHHPDFKSKILQKVATSSRLKIGLDVNAQIQAETQRWEETHVNQVYTEIFLKNLNERLKTICGRLAENLMRGFEMPYDPENRILFGIIQTAVSIGGGFAIRGALFEPPVAVAVAVSGVIFTGLLNLGFISNFKTVCEKAVNVRIEKLSKTYLKQKLRARYETAMKNNMNEALEKMNVEIGKLTEEQKAKEKENTVNNTNMRIFMSLNDMLFKCKQRLEDIEDMCAYPE